MIASSYVFDIPYHPRANSTLTFVQKGLFGVEDNTDVPASVRALLNTLNLKQTA